MKRAAVPHWDAIAAELLAAGVDLDRLCALLTVPRERWWTWPPLAALGPTLAVQALGAQLRDRLGLSWTAALHEAAERLGVDGYSHVRTVKRARARARAGDKAPVVLPLAPERRAG